MDKEAGKNDRGEMWSKCIKSWRGKRWWIEKDYLFFLKLFYTITPGLRTMHCHDEAADLEQDKSLIWIPYGEIRESTTQKIP